MNPPQIALLALFVTLAGAGAYCDVRFRTIPNALNALAAIAGLCAVWLGQGTGPALWAAAHLALALLLGMLAFAARLWGGGDAKFYAALAAWFPLHDFPRLIIAISLAGFVLLLIWFVGRRLRGGDAARGPKAQLPYGVAIAAGGIVTMVAAVLAPA